MRHEPLVILDFETTGLRPECGDRITEVGVVRIENDHMTSRFESLVDCGVRVPSYITAYTGITQPMVDSAPPVRRVMRQLLEFIGTTPVVAHGARFDEEFFRLECLRLGIAPPQEPFICSMQLARRLHPEMPCHALGALSHELKLTRRGTAHRAPADAEVTAELMLRLGHEIDARHRGRTVTARLLRQLEQPELLCA